MAEVVEIKQENLVFGKPKLITDNVMHYCPGCSHGTVHKLVAGVEKESELYLFNQDWQEQDASRIFDGKSLQQLASGLVAKPDTMSEAKFDELKGKIELKIVSALLLQHENSLVVRLALPFVSADDKKAVNAIKVQRKFNWNGKTFKES